MYIECRAYNDLFIPLSLWIF